MRANKFCELGPGDSATWTPCMGHPNDPRTPESDEDAALESIDYAIDWLQMAKIAIINGATVKAQQLIDDARETLAELVGVDGMSTDLEMLLQAYWQAKNEATAAAEKLAEVQAAIVALMPKKDEGTVSQQIGDVKVAVTYGLNRTVNTSGLQSHWNDLPPHAQACFTWKATVAIKEMRSVQQMDAAIYAAAAQYIITAPAKPSLKIERK